MVGPDWRGFVDANTDRKRFESDGYLGEDHSRLMVEADGVAAGFVSWVAHRPAAHSQYWEIGVALLPELGGRGIGTEAQKQLVDYLFAHTPTQRIVATTHVENIAEQKSL